MSDTSAELRIGGVVYSGWTDVKITKSMEQLAHSFQVTVVDRWASSGRSSVAVEPIPIQAGYPVLVDVDGARLITGYIIADQNSYDATSDRVSFSGASMTADLVDCAAIYRTGAWRDKTVLQIARDVCEPFGIPVRTSINLGAPLRKFAIEDSETAFNCIARAARRRSALMLTDADGQLYFDRVSDKRISTVLKYGVNILSASRSNTWAQRFSQYTLKTQTSGSDELAGKGTSLKRTVEDTEIFRYRPTVLLGDNESNGAELKKRAYWERNTRAGQSIRWSYTMQGWSHDGGFWEPNTLVRVKDERNRTDETLLIVSVTFTKSNASGTTTQLDLTRPEAFSVEP